VGDVLSDVRGYPQLCNVLKCRLDEVVTVPGFIVSYWDIECGELNRLAGY
jgi:hypothetical protein